MNKKLIHVIFFLIFVCIQGKSFSDTHKSKKVGPGIIYHDIVLAKGPWAIQVLEIDLTNPFVSLEVIKANEQLEGRKKTSELAASANKINHRVVGAINGDFFSSSGVPHGVHVSQGKILSDPSKWSVFGLFQNKKSFIDVLSLNAVIISDEGKMYPLHHINKKGNEDETALFSHHMGKKADISPNSIEMILSSKTSELNLNDTIIVVIDSLKFESDGAAIPPSGFVLTANGKAQKFFQNYAAIGDTWKLYIGVDPAKLSIEEAISGGPRIVRNGKVSVENQDEGISDSFALVRHPRTAIGFGPDSSRIYFVTVDGRQPGYSVGMSLYELADFMVSLGVTEATNLDGGGSTTMIVRDAIVNRPSDKTGERPIANAIIAISSAPVGKLNKLEIVPNRVNIIAGTDYQLEVKGFDKYFNPRPVDPKFVTWEVDSGFGRINLSGAFEAGEKEGRGIVVCRMDSLADTCFVDIIKLNKIEIYPNPIILEPSQTQKLRQLLFDQKGNKIDQQVSYELSITNELGTINSDLIFSPKRLGQGYVIARWGELACSTQVTIGKKSTKIIEDFEDISDWQIHTIRATQEKCEFDAADSVNEAGNLCGELRYQLEPGGTSAVFCTTSIPVFGEPYAIGLCVFGDGAGHWLRGEFEDKNGNQFLLNFTDKTFGVNWKNEWKTLQVNIAEAEPSWANPSATISFPITWKKIYLAETDENAKNSGSILMDDLTANYIQIP